MKIRMLPDCLQVLESSLLNYFPIQGLYENLSSSLERRVTTDTSYSKYKIGRTYLTALSSLPLIFISTTSDVQLKIYLQINYKLYYNLGKQSTSFVALDIRKYLPSKWSM